MSRKNIKGVLVSLIISGFLAFTLIYLFLNVYLPYHTNKNTVTIVPDLIGNDLRNASVVLTERNLKFEIMTDSGYNSNLPKFSIIEQFPKPESKVKIERTVHLRLNANVPPLITYPDLNGASINLATKQLTALNLFIDSVTYIQDIAVNTVVGSRSGGKLLTAGDKICKGSHITLAIGSSSDSLVVER